MPVFIKSQTIQTQTEEVFVGITNKVQYIINEMIYEKRLDADSFEATVTVFAPHTTAAIISYENADPEVQHDFLTALDSMMPVKQEMKHDNAAAHIKASMLGCSETIPVHKGRLMLGPKQAVYLVEFDGPRFRTITVQVRY